MEQDKEIKKRVRLLIDSNWSGNLSEFARVIKMKPSDLQNMLSNDKRGVPASFFKAVANCGANLNWLVTGRADMLRHDRKSSEFEEIQERLERADFYIEKLENLIKHNSK